MLQLLFLIAIFSPIFADVGLAPDLQPAGADNGGAFRGVLGSCEENRHLYHAFVPSDEYYHCNLAGIEVDLKNKHYPEEDLCDWGFGELIPRPENISGKVHWLPGLEWGRTPGSSPGTTGAELIFHSSGCVMSGSAIMGGSAIGRNMYQLMCSLGEMCGNGTISCCDPVFSDLGLTYPSSMGVYKINNAMKTFIESWRAIYHRPNINFGNGAEYYAGWIRKVVRCKDIPAKLLDLGHIASGGTIPSGWNESEIGYALRIWRGMESLITKEDLTPSFISPPDYPSGPVAPVKPTLSITIKNGEALLTMTGDATQWFAIGFGAQLMKDDPDTLVIYADGTIEERCLTHWAPGFILKLEFTMLSNSVVDGIRNVIVSRNVTRSGPCRFPFPPSGSEVQYIWAVGAQATKLESHVWSGPGNVTVGWADRSKKIPQTVPRGQF